jgi:hypothetical protein
MAKQRKRGMKKGSVCLTPSEKKLLSAFDKAIKVASRDWKKVASRKGISSR